MLIFERWAPFWLTSSIVQLIKKYQENKQNLHIVFIDIEKTYSPERNIRRILKKKKINIAYVETNKEMYEDITTKIKAPSGLTEIFPIKIYGYIKDQL